MSSKVECHPVIIRDPMLVLYKVREIILKNLGHNDLLRSSLVSRLWYVNNIQCLLNLFCRVFNFIRYEIIAVSDAFKKKIEVKVIKGRIDPEVILDSRRQYERLYKDGIKDGPEIVFLGSKYFRTVEFSIHVEKQSDFITYLERFAHSVRELSIWRIKVEILDFEKVPYFPHLTHLNIDNVTAIALLPFDQRHHNLTSLDIGDIKDEGGVLAKNVVYNILVKNKSITRLTLSARLINDIFGNDVSEIFQFKLEQFNVFSALRTKNVEKFLVTHGETLKQITIMIMGDVTTRKMMKREKDFLSVYNIWSRMKVLTKLYLILIRFKEDFRFNEKFVKSLNLKPNYGITEVAVQADNTDVENSLHFLKGIMQLCPNTEFFRTEFLNMKTLRFLVKSMKKLKVIKCDTMEFGSNDFFTELKLNDPDVDPEIDLEGREAAEDEIIAPRVLRDQLENMNIY